MFLVAIWTACKQQTTTHIPQIEYVYTQYENGIPKEAGMLQDTVKQGLWVEFSPTGKIGSISFYNEGKLTGPFIGFRDNGIMSFYMEMNNDLNHGKSLSYYESGQIASEAYWVNDSIDGICTHYSKDGKIEYQVEYRKDELVRVIEGVAPFIEE